MRYSQKKKTKFQDMDYQTTYYGAMAKLAEAQKCQDEIADCNYELQSE